MSSKLRSEDSLPQTAAACAVELRDVRALRTTDGVSDAVTPERRKALLQALRAGEHVELEVDATVFQQTDAPNANFVRFTKNALKKLGKTLAGQPFLRDHAQQEMLARGGTVVRSELVEISGGHAIQQTIKLVKPWAVEAALDGTLDRFSIGWSRNGSEVLCSICEAAIFSSDCTHFPGDKYPRRNGGEVVCEFLFTDALGVESSGVSVPAVKDTSVDEIRVALSAHRAQPTKERAMETLFTSVITILALAAGATEEDAIAAVESLSAKAKALQEALAAQTARTLQLETLLKARDEADAVTKLDALVLRGKEDGKIKPAFAADGKTPAQSETEQAVRKLAATSFKAAEELVAALPRVVPVGPRSLTEQKPTKEQDVGVIDPVQKQMNEALGISDEMFNKHAPKGA